MKNKDNNDPEKMYNLLIVLVVIIGLLQIAALTLSFVSGLGGGS